MQRNILAALAVVALAGCSNASDIENAVRENLVDPESARFGEIVEYVDSGGTEMACVPVNSKNRMGGYGGEKLALVRKQEDGSWRIAGGLRELYEDCNSYIEWRTENNF